MNYTQNKKINQVKKKTLVVGIDIGSEEHYARIFDWRGMELGTVFKFKNTAQGFKDLNNWLEKSKLDNSKINTIIGAEPTGHYWFNLAEYLKKVEKKLVLVNPFHVKMSKELDDNHPSKTDLKDPKTIAKLVIGGRYSEPSILEGTYAELRVANNNRLKIKKDINRIKNKVSRWLKIYSPEYTEVFKDWTGKASLVILERIPLPSEVQKYNVNEINNLWRDKKVRSVGLKRAKQLLKVSKNSIGSSEGLVTAKLEIQGLIEEYRLKEKQHQQWAEIIEKLLEEIPNAKLLTEIKGIGVLTVGCFIAEIGDITKYKSPKQIQKLAGLALRENSSGKHKGRTSISKRGRKRLRTALFQVAMPLVGRVKEFKDLHRYYTTRKNNPLKKKQSIIAICCKLIRIFYAILTKGVKYSSEKLVNDIRRPEVKVA